MVECKIFKNIKEPDPIKVLVIGHCIEGEIFCEQLRDAYCKKHIDAVIYYVQLEPIPYNITMNSIKHLFGNLFDYIEKSNYVILHKPQGNTNNIRIQMAVIDCIVSTKEKVLLYKSGEECLDLYVRNNEVEII